MVVYVSVSVATEMVVAGGNGEEGGLRAVMADSSSASSQLCG